jgi:hypothetical protein
VKPGGFLFNEPFSDCFAVTARALSDFMLLEV